MTTMSLDNHADLVNVTSTGGGVEMGAGYDIRLGRNFSLTPYASFVGAFAGTAKVNGISAPKKVTPNYAQVGLGFTWH
jgi:outer membrane autotransporter protein